MFDSIASQDLFDLTATYYGICILDRLVIISIVSEVRNIQSRKTGTLKNSLKEAEND